MSQLSFDVIKRVWPKSGLLTLFKKYSRVMLGLLAIVFKQYSLEEVS